MDNANGYINQIEMAALVVGLTARNIDFRIYSIYNGLSIRCNGWDAICHNHSYGGREGLIEIMGLPQCEGDVIGYLTAKEVLNMVDTTIKHNT